MTSRATSLLHHVPTALTIIALAAIGWWGHHTGWRAPTMAALRADHSAAKEDWCDEHGVPESRCILCKASRLDQLVAPGASKATTADGAKVGYAQFASEDAVTKAGVVIAAVARAAIAEEIVVPAETDFDHARLGRAVARMPGRVDRVLVTPGETVKAGQVLVLLDAAEIGRAKSELLRAIAQARAADATSERIAASAQAGLRTRAEQAEAEATAQQAQIAVFDSEHALANLGLPVSAADLSRLDPKQLAERVQQLGVPESLLGNARSASLLPVTAACDGVVIVVAAVTGATVETGAFLALVASPDPLWLVFHVQPAQANKLACAQAVTFSSDSLDAAVSGTVTWISPAIDETTRTIPVRATIPNSQGRIPAHLYGTARVVIRSVPDAVVVPEASVQFDGAKAIIFVRRAPDIFEARAVTSGAHQHGQVEIRDGLKGGETIAVSGTEAVKAALYKDRLGAGCTDD